MYRAGRPTGPQPGRGANGSGSLPNLPLATVAEMGAGTLGGSRLTSITRSFSRAPRANPPAAIVAAPAVGLAVADTAPRLVCTTVAAVEAADIRPRLAVAGTLLRLVNTAVAADIRPRLAVAGTAPRLVATAKEADTGPRPVVADTAPRLVATAKEADTGPRPVVAGTALRLVDIAAAADIGHRRAVVADIVAEVADTAAVVVADTAEVTDTAVLANTERVEGSQ